jgi:hypothetical protein
MTKSTQKMPSASTQKAYIAQNSNVNHVAGFIAAYQPGDEPFGNEP